MTEVLRRAALATFFPMCTNALAQAPVRSSGNQGTTSMDQIDMGHGVPGHLLFAPPERPEERNSFTHDFRIILNYDFQ